MKKFIEKFSNSSLKNKVLYIILAIIILGGIYWLVSAVLFIVGLLLYMIDVNNTGIH